MKVTAGPDTSSIEDGTITFKSSFNQNVTFTGTFGEFGFGATRNPSQRTITGFSPSWDLVLDLRDIGFVSANEASFSGTSTSGVLTVSDGAHSAHISLNGDYLASNFICSIRWHGWRVHHGSSGAGAGRRQSGTRHPHALASAIAALASTHASTGQPANRFGARLLAMLTAAQGQLA